MRESRRGEADDLASSSSDSSLHDALEMPLEMLEGIERIRFQVYESLADAPQDDAQRSIPSSSEASADESEGEKSCKNDFLRAIMMSSSGSLSMQQLVGKLSQALPAAARVYGSASTPKLFCDDIENRDEIIAKRREWFAISGELEVLQGLAAFSLATLHDGGIDYLFQMLSSAVCNKLRELTTDRHLAMTARVLSIVRNAFRGSGRQSKLQDAFPTSHTARGSAGVSTQDFTTHSRSPYFRVWSTKREARRAILMDAIALNRASGAHTEIAELGAFKVLVVVENAAGTEGPSNSSGEERTTEVADESTNHSPLAGSPFLLDWICASEGLAECSCVAAASTREMVETLESALAIAKQQNAERPVLVVLHAGAESTLAAAIPSIKEKCSKFSAELCVDGPPLVMLAQCGRRANPTSCFSCADAMLLDPGEWMGFPNCACVSMQTVDPRRSSSVQARQFRARDQASGFGPALALWWVLSRIGVPNIVKFVDQATTLAECLVSQLAMLNGLSTEYDGIACVVRISYAASRVKELSCEGMAHPQISRVNKALYEETRAECKALHVSLREHRGRCSLQFSPTRILRSRWLWLPEVSAVSRFVWSLGDAVSRYESCVSAYVACTRRLASHPDITVVENEEDYPPLSKRLACFCLAPGELEGDWQATREGLSEVKDLTLKVLAHLGDAVETLLRDDHKFRHNYKLLASKSQVRNGKRQPYPDSNAVRHCEGNVAGWEDVEINLPVCLPFSVCIKAGHLTSGSPRVLLEPKGPLSSDTAVLLGEVAANIVRLAVSVTTTQWRGEPSDADNSSVSSNSEGTSNSVSSNATSDNGAGQDLMSQTQADQEDTTLARRGGWGSAARSVWGKIAGWGRQGDSDDAVRRDGWTRR